MLTYQELLSAPPRTVAWSEIIDFDRLDDRRACIDCLYANTLGVNEGSVEWCPNNEPPSKEEVLAWLWFVRPDLGDEIRSEAPAELRALIQSYQGGDLERWWSTMTP